MESVRVWVLLAKEPFTYRMGGGSLGTSVFLHVTYSQIWDS